MSEQTDKPLFINCKANGCPLRIDHVTKWWEPERKRDKPKPRAGVCDYHRQAGANEWTATTNRIKQNLCSIRALQAVKCINDQRHRPQANETVSQWLERIERLLTVEILPSAARSAPATEIERLNKILHSEDSAA